MRHARRLPVPVLLMVLLGPGAYAQQTVAAPERIDRAALREWLTYIASDELQGRATYGEGLGLAAAYIAGHLRGWGVRPAGDDGTYFQTVRVLGVRATSRARVTVNVRGQRRTFEDGTGIAFPRNMGGRQTIDAGDIEFVGYGVRLPQVGHDDYAKRDVRGRVVVWLGPEGPKAAGPELRRLTSTPARNRTALEQGAAAVIAPQAPSPAAGRGQAREREPGGEFITAQRLDRPIPPAVSAEDELLDFLFSGADVAYADLRAMASRQEPLPRVRFSGVTVTFDVDADYEIVRTRLTRNVIGLVEGTDAALKDTYVAFGAHYDHVGYREGPLQPQDDQREPRNPRIFNGADDDGSGTVALMAIARAFAEGPRPRRSLLFVWHAGEEIGLLGSRYKVDYPTVPLENIVAMLNMDMIGRNRNDDPGEANTVYPIGSDRISTQLHEINEQANASLQRPLTLDYQMNDPADPESLYTRSDHYSYAARGIPVIFFTTGLHPDYHRTSDEVDRIEFEKLARIAGLVYETGRRVADLRGPLVRDNLGPRAGATAK